GGDAVSRGIANYMRNRPKPPAQDGDAADGQAADGQAPGSQNAEQRRGSDEMIDEDAIERFGRDLDDADIAARVLAENQEDEDGEDGEDSEPAGTSAPPWPPPSSPANPGCRHREPGLPAMPPRPGPRGPQVRITPRVDPHSSGSAGPLSGVCQVPHGED